MKLFPLFLMGCMLAGGAAARAGEAEFKKDVLSVRAGDYKIVFAPAASAWTIRQMHFKDKLVLSQTGAFQTVISVKRAPDDPQRSSWIGTGHGGEIVESIRLEVDGREQPLTEEMRATGEKFEVIKQSRMGPYLHHSRVRLDGQRLTEEFDYEVVADDSAVHFMYAFMHCFTNKSERWLVELADKTTQNGEFKDDNSFTLKQDIRWAAWHSSAENLGLVYVYPEAYRGEKGFSNAFWNRPRDNKLYFKPERPRGVGQKFGYKVTLQAFEAAPETWESRAKELVAAISEDYKRK